MNLPHSGQPALVKSHSPFDEHFNSVEKPSLIVRIARNPGDHVLRNLVRWPNKSKSNKSYAVFIEQAKAFCNDTIYSNWNAERWSNFHKDWSGKASNYSIPTYVLRYEDITNPNKAEKVMKEMIDFVGGKVRFDFNHSAFLKSPDYSPGRLIRDACGVEVARKINEITGK